MHPERAQDVVEPAGHGTRFAQVPAMSGSAGRFSRSSCVMWGRGAKCFFTRDEDQRALKSRREPVQKRYLNRSGVAGLIAQQQFGQLTGERSAGEGGRQPLAASQIAPSPEDLVFPEKAPVSISTLTCCTCSRAQDTSCAISRGFDRVCRVADVQPCRLASCASRATARSWPASPPHCHECHGAAHRGRSHEASGSTRRHAGSMSAIHPQPLRTS
jgi:hypothetical protein